MKNSCGGAALGAALVGICVILAGCAAGTGEVPADSGAVSSSSSPESASASQPVSPLLQEARTANQGNHVAEKFDQHPVVLDDPEGFAASQLFFDTSEAVILSDTTDRAQLRAASLGVVVHAPVLMYTDDNHSEVIKEIERLGARTVFSVGDVPVLTYSKDLKVIRDPGGLDTLQDATSLKFRVKEVERQENAAAAVAALDAQKPEWLRANYGEALATWEDADGGTVPLQSRQDASMAPQVLALSSSPLPSIATARAYGAKVYVVSGPDPRESADTLVLCAGLAEKPLIAIGAEFGADDELAQRIREAEESVEPDDLNGIDTLPQVAG